MSPKHIVIDARIRRSSTGRYTDRLVEHLQNLDTHNHYTILVQPDDPWEMHNPHFTTLSAPFAQFSLNPLEQIRFRRLIKNLHPDLVHFTMTQQPLFYFGNIVTTTHDLTMFRFVRRGSTPLPLYWLKMGLYRLLVRWSHDKSRRIIVPTYYVAEDVARWQPATKGKLVVTYEDSEPPLPVPGVQPEDISSPFLMYVGTAFPHKNLERLVAAFDLIYAKRPELKLVLVGKTERHYEALKEEIGRHPSAANIIMTGYVPDEQLKWLYEHCEAYVFASLSEGFGLPPLEAMRHHAPVVSSNATCLPEVNGDAAHYFNPLDVEDMAAKIDEVLENPNLRLTLIENGKKQVQKYSWQRMAEQTLSVYRDLLK